MDNPVNKYNRFFSCSVHSWVCYFFLSTSPNIHSILCQWDVYTHKVFEFFDWYAIQKVTCLYNFYRYIPSFTMPIPFHWNTPYIYSFAKSMKEAICHEENDQIHISFYGCYPVLQSRVFLVPLQLNHLLPKLLFLLLIWQPIIKNWQISAWTMTKFSNSKILPQKLQTQLPCVKLMP